MAYQINFTDSVNNVPLIVEDNQVNEETSLNFPGRNTTAYGQIIGENFLKLLENFSNGEPPINPIQGQLWYDNNPGVNQLKIYDGTTWSAAGGLKKAAIEPEVANSIIGDLWVNTDTQQLYLFSGSGWILVGPRFSSGARTGVEAETIVDTTNNPRSVVTNFVEGERLAIISTNDFTPKSTIPGFSSIKSGVNLNSNYNNYFGTSEKSQALIVGSSIVPAANFLRSDVTSNTDFPINIKNSGGLSIGEDSQTTLSLDGESGVLFHKTSGSNLDIRVNDNGSIRTVIRIDSSARVGINNLSPQESLDVIGNAIVSGTLRVNSSLTVAEETTLNSSLTVIGGVTSSSTITAGANILPVSGTSTNIGSPSLPINRIWANRFDGNYYGNVFGNITTSSGTAQAASRLASVTVFKFDGDIQSQDIEFDGQSGGLTKTFNTTLSETFIKDKPEVSDIQGIDEFVVSRGINGLRKITKTNLWNYISRTPIGTIVAFAGTIAPTGWLICDGSEVLVAAYTDLFNVIGYTYGDPTVLLGLGTFKLPDLRGRIPLGMDNMTGGYVVPSKLDPNVSITTGGGSANRVTDSAADNLGLSGGSEGKIISVDNLPDHEHDMRGNAGNQYYAFRNISGAPPDTDAISGQGSLAADLGQYLPTSGGVKSDNPVGQPMNVMNPYLSINYIIFTGLDV
jgi:microcystin-dependent protein